MGRVNAEQNENLKKGRGPMDKNTESIKNPSLLNTVTHVSTKTLHEFYKSTS